MRGKTVAQITEGVNPSSLAVSSEPLSVYSMYELSNLLTPANTMRGTSVNENQFYDVLQ